ncbi:MAG: NAD(P)H-dependent oxidoreductase subunit E [Bacteroidota bacterium]
MSKNLSELSGRKGLEKNLFEEYGKSAADSGTLSNEEMDRLRDEFLVGKSSVYGAITFYDFLRPENQGKKAYVCNGTACMTAGTQDDVRKKLNNHFSANEIGEMCCLGRCHENGAFHVNGKNFSGSDIDSLKNICEKQNTTVEKYHV